MRLRRRYRHCPRHGLSWWNPQLAWMLDPCATYRSPFSMPWGRSWHIGGTEGILPRVPVGNPRQRLVVASDQDRANSGVEPVAQADALRFTQRVFVQ